MSKQAKPGLCTLLVGSIGDNSVGGLIVHSCQDFVGEQRWSDEFSAKEVDAAFESLIADGYVCVQRHEEWSKYFLTDLGNSRYDEVCRSRGIPAL